MTPVENVEIDLEQFSLIAASLEPVAPEPVEAEPEFDLAGLEALAASGSTALALSDRGRAWDAAGADKRVREWAGATDAPNAKYASAFFWKDSAGGDKFGDYKLGFADVIDGSLTAVWRGVTAVAAALQGSRGGVELPEADVAGVKAKVASYYSKAAKEYDDPNIKTPWETASIDAEVASTETADDMGSCAYCAHSFASHPNGGMCSVVSCSCEKYDDGGGETMTAAADDTTVVWGGEAGFMDLMEDLEDALNGPADTYAYQVHDVRIDLTSALVSVGWDDYYVVPFTLDADNEPTVASPADWVEVEQGWVKSSEGEAELAGLRRVAMVRAFQHGMPCACGHSLSQHLGAGGPCSHEDGRGTCSCKSFDEASADAALDHLNVIRRKDVAAAFGFPSASTNINSFDLTAQAALAPAVELPPEHAPGSTVPDANPDAEVLTPPEPVAFEWIATLCPEAQLTSDGRVFAPGAIVWPRFETNGGSLTLMGMDETSEGGHVGARIAGRIDSIWREANLIRATGVFVDTDWGRNIAGLVADGTLRGISVDLAIHEYEFAPKSDYFDADGNWAPRAEGASAEPSLPELMDGKTEGGDEIILVVKQAEIGMATVCPFQAFAEATIQHADSLVAGANPALWTVTMQSGMTVTPVVAAPAATEAPAEPEALVASGLVPLLPPADWFADPELPGPTPITVDDEGRVYGHAALWNTCHIGIAGVCTQAPPSPSNYAYFHLGEVQCEGGERIACGTVTLDAAHADKRLGRADASRHYDHTGTAAAHVVCGQDEHGIWVAGALDPRLPEDAVRTLRGSKLSGDWRNVNGSLELVALLAVNVPGFPVPRALVASIDGEDQVLTLIAAGLGMAPEVTDAQRAAFATLAAQADTAVLRQFEDLADRV